LLVGYRIAAIIRDSHVWQHHGSNHEEENVSERICRRKESNRSATSIINLRLSVLVTIIIRCTVRIRLRVPQNKQRVVGTGCDSGFKSRQGKKCFLQIVQTGFEECPTSYSGSIGAYSWKQSGRGVRMTTHLRLVSRLGMCKAITLLIYITGGLGGM
jgi:hypothetical protein